MTAPYPFIHERTYCSMPADSLNPDIVFVGSGIGLSAAWHLVWFCREHSIPIPKIVVLDAGPFDLPCHLGDLPGYARFPFIQSPERLGGKLSIWGVSIPRPREDRLALYPYPLDDLRQRFAEIEQEMGGPDAIPESGATLESELLYTLREEFNDDGLVSVAPLAINRRGKRWTPLMYVPRLIESGVKLITRFNVTRMERVGDRISAVHGRWENDGKEYCIRPRAVVVAVGVEKAIPLLSPVLGWNRPRQISDHHRIDFNAILPPRHFGDQRIDEQGVAVVIVELVDDEDGVCSPFHLEVKCAPLRFWREGFMQSSDNLCGSHSDDTIYFQVQAVGAMNDSIPPSEFVNVSGIRPAMSLRDSEFHGRIVRSMKRVCNALRVSSPSVFFRPIAQNHHLYRACTVGIDVDSSFRSMDTGNLTILPPTAFFDHHCDANPTLKSVVLAQYAMEDLAHQFESGTDRMIAQKTGNERQGMLEHLALASSS